MYSMPIKSTLKTRARRVFGDIVTEDAVENNSSATTSSLSYSPSPVTHRKILQEIDEVIVPPAPKTITFQEGTKPGSDEFVLSDKENAKNNQQTERPAHEGDRAISKPINDLSHRKREELHRLRKQSKSPLRRDLVKKTQQAINDATSSVNQSLNAVRLAKEEKFQEKVAETAALREQWRDEKEDAQEFYAQAEKSRHELLSLQRQLSSKFAKAKAQRDIDERNAQLAAIDRETQFKSEVYRKHKHALKDEADRKRRQSIAARRKLRRIQREGEEKMKMTRIEEDQALLEERHLSSIAWRETSKTLAEKRRKSFAFRNGDARRIRKLHAKMEAERQEREHLSFELKFAGERDVDAYKRALEEQRRDSFALRNQEGHKQREQESLRRYGEQNAQHLSFELKWAGERDAMAYKRQLEEERRSSFNFRNSEGHRQREEAAIRLAGEQAAEHASYDLKLASERDAEAYRKKLQEERRDSFAFRNQEGRKQRTEEEQRRANAQQNEHQSFELKWAGEKDAEEYRRQMEEERRQSFADRNKEGRRQRGLQNEQEMHALAESHQSYELKWLGERDAKAYQKKIQKERRDSYAFRNKEGRSQREDASARAAREHQHEHESIELKWAGERDVDAYKKKLEQERRDSFKFRNEECARHAKVMEELTSLAQEKETESFMLKWAGENDAKAYLSRMEEERRQSFRNRKEAGRRHREFDEEARQQSVQEAHVEEALQAASHKDLEDYKRQCAARDRASLVFRRKEAYVQRLEDQNRQDEERKVEEANLALEEEARHDVEEYLKDCKQRRRMSLALRAKEKRRHVQWQEREAELRRQQHSRDTRDRALDRRYVEMAKREERARIAMDAIRHAQCTFALNPFAGLLER